MATILYPDGSQREITPENGTNFILKELQSIVGGWIELIQCRDGRLMVINENGRLEGLPYNEQATALINWASENEIGELKAEMGDSLIIAGDPACEASIVGTVLVCENDQVQ